MKTTLVSTIILFTLSLFIFLPHTAAVDTTKWGLPEGAIARLGKGGVYEIAYSPDGTRLAVATSIGIWMYDAQTYEARSFTTEGRNRLWFSPDWGTSVGSKYDEHNRTSTISLWDANTGELRHTLTEHAGQVSSAVFSPDGQTLLIFSSDDSNNVPDIRLWDVNTGERLHTFTGHTGWAGSAVFSPDGLTLLIYSRRYSNEAPDVNLWDANTGELLHTLTGHTGQIENAVFSPDGLTLATSWYGSESIYLWDVETGTRWNILLTDAVGVDDVAFSPDGQTLVSANFDNNVQLWDVYTGTVRLTLERNRYYSYGIQSVFFSPDGQTLAGAGYNEVPLWDVNTGELRQSLSGHVGWINDVAFSPDGLTLASASHQDGTIRFWDVNTGGHRQTLTGHAPVASPYSDRSVLFSPDGQTLASGDRRYIYLWDTNTSALRQTFNAYTLTVYSISFSPDGQTIACAGQGNSVWLLDANTGSLLRELIGHTHNISSVSFSPDGQTLASGSDDKTIRLWDVKTGEHLRTFTGHTGSVETVTFSPDGQTLASGNGQEFYLWDVKTGTFRQIGTGDGGVYNITFSPDGQTIASATYWPPSLRLWDVDTGEHLRTLTGHTGSVRDVAFSPDGQTIASGGSALHFWDVNTGRYLQSLTAYTTHRYSVSDVVFSPDGQTLASGNDGTVLLWDLNLILGPSDESPNIVEANTPIRGPWLWMIAPTEPGQGGAASTDVDSLAVASGGAVTEADVAANGATEGDIVGDYAWTLAELPEESNVDPSIGNINQMLVTAGVTENSHLNDFSSYALIVLESMTDQSDVIMRVGSDDSIKVWLNGSVVHTKAVNRASRGFDDTFTVNLVAGDNLLLVKVSEWISAWKMYVGIDVDVTLKVPMATPEPAYSVADVNADGEVSILDLVAVAAALGETGENDADVNGDGEVNIQDLVAVAAALGEVAAAPAVIRQQVPGYLTTADVQHWLTQAQALNLTDPTSLRGIHFLEQLLAALAPKETALLPNYPNPFNPETWIPYQLAQSADVTLNIYAANGVLVRTLAIGHQPVGSYHGKNRAAHWDGRNAVGELVASGVYFYTLTAGDFTATRKMLILK